VHSIRSKEDRCEGARKWPERNRPVARVSDMYSLPMKRSFACNSDGKPDYSRGHRANNDVDAFPLKVRHMDLFVHSIRLQKGEPPRC